jgi:hypothetical protein
MDPENPRTPFLLPLLHVVLFWGEGALSSRFMEREFAAGLFQVQCCAKSLTSLTNG